MELKISCSWELCFIGWPKLFLRNWRCIIESIIDSNRQVRGPITKYI